MRKTMTRRTAIGSLATIGGAIAISPTLLSGMVSEDKKLGVALVGLGGYSKGKLAPAFEHTKYCRLAGIGVNAVKREIL